MARLIWTERALDDLGAILNYIGSDSPAAARRYAQRVIDRLEALEQFPEMGSWLPEDRSRTYRQLVQGNYRLVYRETDEAIYVVTLHHAARILRTGEL